MINEEWNKTQNDAPFVAFYNMRAVTFVPPDEMADVSIAGRKKRSKRISLHSTSKNMFRQITKYEEEDF